MRTTIEMPDELLEQARLRASEKGISLKQFFIESVENSLVTSTRKRRRNPPVIGGPNAPRFGVLAAEQIDEAMFG
jgi:hypothetical protein